MSDLLTEVDEMMRQERMEKLWKEHGKTFIGIIIGIILFTAIFSAYKSWNIHVQETQTAKLVAMLDDSDFPSNIDPDTLKLRGGLKGMALLNAGAAYLAQDKNAEALEIYQRAAGDSSIAKDLRQLAALMSVRLQTATPENAQDLITVLEPVWNDGGSPWRLHARLEAAALFAAQGHFEAARDHLSAILTSDNTPEGLYNTARALDHVYALKAQQDPS